MRRVSDDLEWNYDVLERLASKARPRALAQDAARRLVRGVSREGADMTQPTDAEMIEWCEQASEAAAICGT